MRTVLNIGAALVISAAASLWAQDPPASGAARSGVTGTWKSAALPGWMLILKAEGARLTGVMNACSSSPSITIANGLVDGNTLNFTCTSEDGDRTLTFVGKRNGEEITFTWHLQVRAGGRPPDVFDWFSPTNTDPRYKAPPEFRATRAPDAAGEVLLDRVAERARTSRRVFSPVTFERILHAEREPHNWLTYSGTLNGQRHSALAQITPANVAQLELAWIWGSQSTGRFEATPLVVDGVMFTVQAPNDVVALDALTGATLWTYAYTPAPGTRATGGGGRPNRGLAILGDTLFMGTLDAHLLGINAKTGKLIWNTTVANAADPACKVPDRPWSACYVITHAPLVVKDKVIVGTGGGDGYIAGYGIRGFIAAFDAASGKEAWRFHTIPGPGEPGNNTWSGDSWKTGGAGVWLTGTYDPDLNLTFWGTGNPVPTEDGSSRLGDNLYSNSVVALDADSGALKWHYQFTPHDEMDWDSAHIPVLIDVQWQGTPRKALVTANKNGLVYVLDRRTGQFLSGKPYVQLNWMTGFDEKGRPLVVRGQDKAERVPTSISGTNWSPPSFNPTTGLFYIPARERTSDGPGNAFGAIRAYDPSTGGKKWEFIRKDTWFLSGVLTTVSGLMFTGSTGDSYSGPTALRRADGYFYALDAQTGQLLWQMGLAGSINSTPMTYSAGGTQHIAVTAGNFLFAFALRP